MRSRCAYLLFITLFFCLACQENDEGQRDIVAKVFDETLTREDLARRLPLGISQEDSLKRARVILNSWVHRQVLLHQAKFNLDPEELRFEEMIEDYENDLYIHEFEQRYISEKMDTAVTKEEILGFFEGHEDDFQLKRPAVRFRFLSFEVEAIDVKERDVKKAFRGYNEEDSLFIADFAQEFAERFISRDGNWTYLEDLAAELPWDEKELEGLLDKKDYIEKSVSSMKYMLFIEEIRWEKETSPIDLVSEKIKSTILNQRKLKLISEMRSDLFQNALGKGDIYILE